MMSIVPDENEKTRLVSLYRDDTFSIETREFKYNGKASYIVVVMISNCDDTAYRFRRAQDTLEYHERFLDSML